MAVNGEKTWPRMGRNRRPLTLIEDETGQRLLGETFRHDEPGITSLCDALKCFEVELVAIERGDGVLVERLLEAGHTGARCNPGRARSCVWPRPQP